VSLQRFNVGDVVKASNLGECGIVEKVEEHYDLKWNTFRYVYWIRLLINDKLTVWFYDETLTKVG
jgi:hypothetical protein